MLLRCCLNRNYRPISMADHEELDALYRSGWKMLEKAKMNEGGSDYGKDNINESKPQPGDF